MVNFTATAGPGLILCLAMVVVVLLGMEAVT